MKKLFLFSLVLLGFSAGAFAQLTNSATASASATIVSPLTIEKKADMNFGNIISTTAGGSVALGVDNTRTPSVVDLTTGTTTINVSAASFEIKGTGSETYTLTIPVSVSLTGTGDPMTVGTFLTDLTLGGKNGTIDPSGTSTVKLGATLTVGANQVAGSYSNASDLIVTVNYN